MVPRSVKWTGCFLLALVLAIALFVAFFDWNWLRGPIARKATEKTGREFAINGDLTAKLHWPLPRLRAEGVTFANPPWAKEPQMLAADAAEVTIDLSELFSGRVTLAEVHLDRAVVFLEKSVDGRKNWLLDSEQRDEDARLGIGLLTLDHGKLGYDDPNEKTSIRSEISTSEARADGTPAGGVIFSAQGRYKGLALKARGNGGPVLALRDESTPYPLKIDATIGATGVRADGTITSLLKFSAIDMRVALRGGNLEDLFPLIGIVLPATPPYSAEGHLIHNAQTWRYEKFSGRIGVSDIAGTLQVDTGGARPFMHGELVSKLLDLDDLGPLIGARPGSVEKAAKEPAPQADRPAATATAKARVLPDVPFKTDRWDTVDADVKLSAKTIRRAKELPLENLVTHLKLRDSVLTLDPLNFGVAGGDLVAAIVLDGQKDPIRARAKVQAKKLHLNKLFPTVDLSKTSVGQIDGTFELAGRGNSVAHMLATADGKVGLVIAGGEISNQMMEIVGLDLWEWFGFKVKGDQPTTIRCGVADFGVKSGVMQVNALVLDTEDTNVSGSGSIDLRQETLALTLNPQPKDKSPISLRGPIHIRGTLAKPAVQIGKGRIAARGLGAIALAIINPLLAIIPLIETGPGLDSDCGQLIRAAQEPARPPKPSGRTRAAAP